RTPVAIGGASGGRAGDRRGAGAPPAAAHRGRRGSRGLSSPCRTAPRLPRATSSRVRWRATRFLPSGRRAEYERPAIPCPELVDASSCAGASIKWCSHGLQADGEVAVCGGRLSLVGNSGTKKSYGQTIEQS